MKLNEQQLNDIAEIKNDMINNPAWIHEQAMEDCEYLLTIINKVIEEQNES